ncbi:MAG: hypothetical protein V1889_00965 [archaeon]
MKKNFPFSHYPLRTTHYLLFATYYLLPLARAGPVEGVYQLTDGLQQIIRILIQFISETIFQINSFDEFLFAKILLFSIILLIVYTVISQNSMFGGTGKNKAIQWIISSAISILAIRYLPNEFVQAILLQYGAFAVAITVFLPLMIYFFFIHQSGVGPFGRKIAWIVYITGFFALWSMRYQDLGEANWIYWIAIGFIIICLIFDKKIHEYFGWSSIRKARRAGKLERRIQAQEDLDELERRKEYLSDKEYRTLEERYKKRIKDNMN